MTRQKINSEQHKDTDKIKPASSLIKEIQAIIFFFFCVFLGVSLLSYSPSDQICWNVTGHITGAHNMFGIIGAHVAWLMLFMFGFAAFWFVVLLFIFVISLFRGRSIQSPLSVCLAFIALVISFSSILSLQLQKNVVFKGAALPEGSGGFTGLFFSDHVGRVLNFFGANVFFIVVFVLSLMFITRLSVLRLLSVLWVWITMALRHLNNLVIKRKERKKRALHSLSVRQELKSRPKVTIVKKDSSKMKVPEQKRFSFMNVVDEFELPSIDLLSDPVDKGDSGIRNESLEMNARRLEKKLRDFGVRGEVVEVLPGPVITMYEYKPAPGIKISKVAGLNEDLALALRAPSIRVVPNIPGKGAIGIEIPNNHREMVFLKDILSSPEYRSTKYKLPIALGKDITGSAVVTDLTRMPHLLVAGATGTGKSVCINTMIASILYKLPPSVVRFLMIDPKRIELSAYHDIPHLLHPVVTMPKDATKALKWAVTEMERRYMLLSDRGVRNIESYNRKVLSRKSVSDQSESDNTSSGTDRFLPYIILIIDELADLMMVSSREVEEAIARLAQMARAAGIHLIIATQRPSVDVLTGVIKANFPARISFQVSSKVDSRTIIDTMGAENLLGDGDMLFLPPGVARVQRIHGAFISEEEVSKVTDFIRNQKGPDYDKNIIADMAKEDKTEDDEIELDEKYEDAVNIVMKTGQASISMLQRKLRVGYNRAARMIEVMESKGIVGPSDGVRPREVYGRHEEN